MGSSPSRSPLSYLACLALTACAAGAPQEAERDVSAIFYGTRDPQISPLTEGQKLAIGWLHSAGYPDSAFCTGTLVGPGAVVTARHCFEDGTTARETGFGVGLYPYDPVASLGVSQVHLHPSVDAAVLILAENAQSRVPSITPIATSHASPSGYVGQQLDAAGYGRTHDGSVGRYFAAVYLEQVDAYQLVVNGRGEQGICSGDSGGPLIGPGPAVLSVESGGDMTCVDLDAMTRLDVIASWLDPLVGTTPTDPCDGLDYLGRCEDAVAVWCQDGAVQRYDCAAEGLGCGYVDDEVGYYCTDAADPCGGLDYLGRCEGTVAVWCEEDAIQRFDCADEGLGCGYVDGEVGYYCVDPAAACSAEDTRCDGDRAVRCVDGSLQVDDCASRGAACVAEEGGPVCSDGGPPDDDSTSGSCRCRAGGGSTAGRPGSLLLAAGLLLTFGRLRRR